ncbi:hypothetical protein MPSEU_000544900 [Mayamaea pseudoterrestris]|nr:hypothetical protein MPSEU_000544900 [Mayamaea pseudoterrestris]
MRLTAKNVRLLYVITAAWSRSLCTTASAGAVNAAASVVTNQHEASVCQASSDDENNPQCVVAAQEQVTSNDTMRVNHDLNQKEADALTANDETCRLYMLAPSSASSESTTRLFTGVSLQKGDLLLLQEDTINSDLHVRITDANKNEWSPWHDVLWSATKDFMTPAASRKSTSYNTTTSTSAPPATWLLQNDFQLDWFVSGLASMAQCVFDDYELDEDDQDEAASPSRVNVVPELVNSPVTTTINNHMNDPAFDGSFASADNHGAPIIVYRAIRDLRVGDELFVACHIHHHDAADFQSKQRQSAAAAATTTTTPANDSQAAATARAQLNRDGVCMDALSVQSTTLPNTRGQRGAFTRRAIQTGQAIAKTPVIPLDKSQLEISKQAYYTDLEQDIVDTTTSMSNASNNFPSLLSTRRKHGILYQADIPAITQSRQQLLLNYVFGSENSHVLLLPVAPGASFINHATSSTKQRERQRRAAGDGAATNASATAVPVANAYLRWWSPLSSGSDSELQQHGLNNNAYYHSLSAHDLLDEYAENGLWMEIVALRDLQPGEEVLIDYGSDWEVAWQMHAEKLVHEPQAERVTASQYAATILASIENATISSNPTTTLIRTLEQQESQPYPSNLATACTFSYTQKVEHKVQSRLPIVWEPQATKGCMRFCDVLSYAADSNTFTVRIYPRLGERSEQRVQAGCGGKSKHSMPKEGFVVEHFPEFAIALADKPYSLDFQQPHAFRHFIGVSDPNFYPPTWNKKDARPNGDFIPTPLGPGQLEVIRWADTGKVVTSNAYRIGMPESVRETLLEYCRRMGVVDIFKHITMQGNSLDIGTDTYLNLDGEEWYLQRPDKKWNSNLQWLSPGDNAAHNHYLEALSVAGFDSVLQSIGERFQMEGLVAFHLTFMAVSQSTRGYLHYDVTRTQAKAFNVIIPLILANETGPELDLQNYDEDEEDESKQDDRIGRYRYEYHVASMMGDDALHASSAVDYRVQKEMRLAATIYVADVNEANVNEIMSQYTQAYPPNDRDLLLSWAGTHWKKDDPSAHLPTPRKGHVLTEPKVDATASM